MSNITPAPYDPTLGNVAGYLPGQGLRRLRRDLGITALGTGSHTHIVVFGDSVIKGFNATAAVGRIITDAMTIEIKRGLGLNAGLTTPRRFAATNEYVPPQFTATGGTAWDVLNGIGDGAVYIPAGGGGAITLTCAQYLVNYSQGAGYGTLGVTDSLGAISIAPFATAGGAAGYFLAASPIGADAARTLTFAAAGGNGSHMNQVQFLNAAEAAAGTVCVWNAGNFGGTNATHYANSTKYDFCSTTTQVDVAACVHMTWQNYGSSNYLNAVSELETLISLIDTNRRNFNQHKVDHIITTPYPSANLTAVQAGIMRAGAIGLAKRLNANPLTGDACVVDIYNLLGDCTPAVDLAGWGGNQFTDGSTHLIDKGMRVAGQAIGRTIVGLAA